MYFTFDLIEILLHYSIQKWYLFFVLSPSLSKIIDYITVKQPTLDVINLSQLWKPTFSISLVTHKTTWLQKISMYKFHTFHKIYLYIHFAYHSFLQDISTQATQTQSLNKNKQILLFKILVCNNIIAKLAKTMK